MAPTSTSTPPIARRAEKDTPALPGMKRGIAIGVAASVCILLIALVAFFAIQRRKKIAAKANTSSTSTTPSTTTHSSPASATTPSWPQEKQYPPASHWKPSNFPQPQPPVEADANTRAIYELPGDFDAAVPELPSRAHTRTPPSKPSAAAEELESGRAYATFDYAAEIAREDRAVGLRSLPVLQISPPEAEASPLAGVGAREGGGGGWRGSVSSLSVSPLEEGGYLPSPGAGREVAERRWV
ncbi:hypothetical protein BU26DRAFT_491173 [Trematosphaeria pertusa]|uniref:Uncharacterized protein n=1 Tax=Trematosphaeria pertusa TaxID=390896 RepID=A0A6A6I3T8_9PLEO|nr:uncharacterized protein BU26DRAFT_491173 [Trematosphaeria pertusa]KAF2245001.1 hypothetical protein BU26DRAFT_491173 [Trematosphaeria pertusa]